MVVLAMPWDVRRIFMLLPSRLRIRTPWRLADDRKLIGRCRFQPHVFKDIPEHWRMRTPPTFRIAPWLP
jgi:hypothetical protein